MKTKVTLSISGSLFIDAIAVLFIIYLGELSDFIGYPLYILDPMRMMVVLAFAFTPRWNSWVLALLLPIISYYFGAHPSMAKSGLMIMELLINVGLFWYLLDKTRFTLLSMLLSILFSKAVYYLLKYLFIEQQWLSGDLVSTPLDIQVITTIAFSVFVFLVFLTRGRPAKH